MIRKPEDLLINKEKLCPSRIGNRASKTEDRKRYPRISLSGPGIFLWIERPKAKGGNTPRDGVFMSGIKTAK